MTKSISSIRCWFFLQWFDPIMFFRIFSILNSLTTLNFIKRIYLTLWKQSFIIVHENLLSFLLYQAESVIIDHFVCLSIKIATAEFSVLCKRIEYISRDTEMAERKERVQSRGTPLSFCFTHSRVKSKGGRTERGRDGGRTRAQDEERFTGEHPTSALVATHRGIRIRGRSSSLPHLTSPRSLQRSLLFCILHWRWDLVVRFADAPPFRPSSHRTRSIVLLLQERSVPPSRTSHVPRG